MISPWNAVWRGMVLFRLVALSIQSLKTFISNTSNSPLANNFGIRTGVFGPMER